MSLLEQQVFLKNIPPFDTLKDFELESLCEHLDIQYFQKDQIIIDTDEKPEHLYFIIKGVVQEFHDEEMIGVYSNDEFFDPISLIENKHKHKFICVQEAICYTLSKEIFLKTIYANESLERFFFQSIAQKLNINSANEQNKEFANFLVSRVKDAFLQKPVIIDATLSIYETVQIMKEKKLASIIVFDGSKYGIVTDTDFKEKVILNKLDFNTSINEIATFNLLTISENEFLFNAQLQMNKYGVKRLVVINEEEDIVGVLGLIALTSFFATHTYSVIMELDHAQTLEELKFASKKFIRVIRVLFAKGVKVRYISKIIGQLNNKLFTKLFTLLAPKELQEQSALIVMGSEGRAEQILRTDQDNALILNDNCNVDLTIIQKFTKEYTQHMIDFGFPACPGNIMVSNPFWVKKQSDFEKTIFEWINKPDTDGFMNLAIFYDSFCVAGNKTLLLELKNYLTKISSDSSSFHTYFAKAVLQFETPLSMFSNFIVDKKEHKDELDIKKGGIFPVVHGIRSLALENHITKTTTVERIKALNDKDIINKELASELIESFNFLLALRLKFRLEKIDARLQPDNYINPEKLNSLEKDLLRDSFKVVDKFKKFITYHYKLNMLS